MFSFVFANFLIVMINMAGRISLLKCILITLPIYYIFIFLVLNEVIKMVIKLKAGFCRLVHQIRGYYARCLRLK